MTTVTATPCRPVINPHFWILDPSDASGVSRGVCRKCGEAREFSPFFPPERKAVARSQRTGWCPTIIHSSLRAVRAAIYGDMP